MIEKEPSLRGNPCCRSNLSLRLQDGLPRHDSRTSVVVASTSKGITMKRLLIVLALLLTNGFAVAETKPLNESAAVQTAEHFVIHNGYTDVAPSEDGLARESIERSTDTRDLLKVRHDTLESKAYGMVYQRKGGSLGWTVVFRYKHLPTSTTGRAVTMGSDGSNIRVEHVDFILSKVDKVFQK